MAKKKARPGKPPSAGKPNKATAVAPAAPSDADVRAFLALVIRGYSADDLQERVQKELPHAALADLLAAAQRHFRQAAHADPDVVRGFCIEAYREIYRVALDYGEFSVALKALARLEAASK
jgi:hypothetical protein